VSVCHISLALGHALCRRFMDQPAQTPARFSQYDSNSLHGITFT
jgi:hypothetical protein